MVLQQLNESYPVDSPYYPEYEEVPEIDKVSCCLMLMDEGLFVVPEHAIFKEGRGWTARWSQEELKELRILIQA